MTKQIPFFNYPSIYKEHGDEYASLMTDICSRGAYIMQQELLDFEKALAEYLGVKYAFGVGDGTMALIMGVRAAGLEPGSEVIVPSHTFVASAAAIHHAGCIPVLADCGPDHLIDGSDIAKRITKKTSAIMPVQLNGRVANMDPIEELCRIHDLKIIEDSCQALGAKFGGKFAGTFGAAGAFSFYPSKTLGCFGDGGAVVTNSDEVAEQIELMRDHGRNASGSVSLFGYNSRLDNVQAGVLLLKLRGYGVQIEKRRVLAARYHEGLDGLSSVFLPPAPDAENEHFDIFQNYEIEAEKRDDLRTYLAERGIGTILQWGGKAIHQFAELDLNQDVPRTEAMTHKFMLLPMNTSLCFEDVDYICEQIHNFYNK